MKKFTIENKETEQIICRCNGRHYRQSKEAIGDGLEVVKTTLGRATKERDWLNTNYGSGWDVYEVEGSDVPKEASVLSETDKMIRKYENKIKLLKSEHKKEIAKVTKETAKFILKQVKNVSEPHIIESIVEFYKISDEPKQG